MKIKFVPQDCWIGLYWKTVERRPFKWRRTYYLCIVPCFPIMWERNWETY